MVGGDILWEMMVGCLEDGPKWCSILVSTTEVRTTLLFYIYGSWVSKRILILRDRIPNFFLHSLLKYLETLAKMLMPRFWKQLTCYDFSLMSML